MRDDTLARVAEEANVFCRVMPAQKDRIINALRNNGHAVGFLGDGINDAPSLRSADVGISVDARISAYASDANIV
jgi:Mg2+-importing ATPase